MLFSIPRCLISMQEGNNECGLPCPLDCSCELAKSEVIVFIQISSFLHDYTLFSSFINTQAVFQSHQDADRSQSCCFGSVRLGPAAGLVLERSIFCPSASCLGHLISELLFLGTNKIRKQLSLQLVLQILSSFGSEWEKGS